MAVGVSDIAHLRKIQEGRRLDVDGRSVVRGYTRRRPRRVAEVTDGGSIYWIIKGMIQVRQRVLDLVEAVDDEGKTYCQMRLDPELAPTQSAPRRAMQGWRYLEPADAPPDLSLSGDDDALPAHVARELRSLGLL